MTRAQAAAAQVHVDAPTGTDQSVQITEDQRAPLGELAPNSLDGDHESPSHDKLKTKSGRKASVQLSTSFEEQDEEDSSQQTDDKDETDNTKGRAAQFNP